MSKGGMLSYLNEVMQRERKLFAVWYVSRLKYTECQLLEPI